MRQAKGPDVRPPPVYSSPPTTAWAAATTLPSAISSYVFWISGDSHRSGRKVRGGDETGA